MRKRNVLALLLAVVSAGCSQEGDPTGPGPRFSSTVEKDGIRFSADAAILEILTYPSRYSALVEIHNTTSSTVDLEFPDRCMVLMTAYATEDRSGAALWTEPRTAYNCVYQEMNPDNPDRPVSSRDVPNPRVPCAEAVEACRVRIRLAPGAKKYFSNGFTVAEIRESGVTAETLHLSALIRPNGTAVEIPAGSFR